MDESKRVSYDIFSPIFFPLERADNSVDTFFRVLNFFIAVFFVFFLSCGFLT